MSQPSKEARLLLAVQAFQRNPKEKLRVLARYYTMPYSTLQKRVQGQLLLSERRLVMHKLTEIEEKVILQRVIDLDTRGFSPRLSGVKEIANLILQSRGGGRVGKNWTARYIARQPDLSTRFNRVYDYQRALCEDPELIQAWF